MANATLSLGQIAVLIAARRLDDESRSTIKNQVFTSVKQQFGIPEDHRLTVEIDNEHSAEYGVLYRKKDHVPYALNAAGKAVAYPPAAVITPEKRWFRVDLNYISLGDAVDDMRASGKGFFYGALSAHMASYPVVTSDDDFDFKVVDNDIYVQLTETDFYNAS